VHGLGGSHLNWCQVGPRLAEGRRAVAVDLHGFGLTPGSRRQATVQANARLVDRFSREVTGTPVILVGNSMGGLICVLQAAANPDAVAGLVLIDPALPLPRQAPDWPELTESEFAVVSLVGRGATNREVAERLFLSPYTVSSHLRHVFTKLGLTQSNTTNNRVRAVLAFLRSAGAEQ